MKLTLHDKACRNMYARSESKQLGNLHERMRYVMALLTDPGVTNPDAIGGNLWHAIFDLETEVQFHEPKMPPCGKRGMNLNESPR